MITSFNPYSNKAIQTIAFDSTIEINNKLSLAHEAYHIWKNTHLTDKKEHFNRLIEILTQKKEILAEEITIEMGKPIIESIAEIEKCIGLTKWYLTEGEHLLERHLTNHSESNIESYVQYAPMGCILGIMPWNFPYWQVFRFAIPTLLIGNTVLLKHAPNVQTCATHLANLFQEAGFPNGIFQNTHASIDSIESIIASPTIQGVTFTGSDRAGKAVGSLAGKYLKKSVLELGGSDPFIVLPDANISLCVEQAVKSRLLNNGQSCIAAKRFIIHTDCYAAFIQILKLALDKIQIGDPMLKSTQLGPMARPDIKEQLHQQVQKSIALGSICSYKHTFQDTHTNFFAPIILEQTPSNSPARTEELFGPVFTCIKITTVDEAIRIANETSFGLGASIWTSNMDTAMLMAKQIEAGSVFINDMTRSDTRLPFGGIKQSGYGRELSTYGLSEFANIKTYWINK